MEKEESPVTIVEVKPIQSFVITQEFMKLSLAHLTPESIPFITGMSSSCITVFAC